MTIEADSAPRRTSPITALFVPFDQRLRALTAVGVLNATRGGWATVGLLFGLVVMMTIGAVEWYRKTWWFDGEVLVMTEGVFVRKDRRFRVDRIQHIELERRFRHLVTGLAVLRVETAGGGGDAELELDAISLRDAERLRDLLQRARRPATAPDGVSTEQIATPPPDGAGDSAPAEWHGSNADLVIPRSTHLDQSLATGSLLRLGVGRLALGGVTGPEIVAVLLALGFVLDALGDAGIEPDEQWFDRVAALGIAVGLVVGVFVWVGAAAAVGVARYWDLRVTIDTPADGVHPTDADQTSATLVVRYGLFRQAELTASLSRVQVVQVQRPALRRILGFVDVEMRSAASGSSRQASTVRIPMLRPDEAERVLTTVFPGAHLATPLDRPPDRARVRLVVRSTVPLLVAASIVAVLLRETPAGGAAVVLVAIGAGVWRGVLRHRTLGVALTTTHVHSRTGAFASSLAIAPLPRVQSAVRRSSVFQRRRRLASVGVDVPGRRLSLPERDHAEADRLLRGVLSATGAPSAN